MTKQELVRELTYRTNLSNSQALHAVESVIDIISDVLVNQEAIYIRGFGSFKLVQRASRQARNIVKGTVVKVPARKQLKFTAYDALQARIDNEDYDYVHEKFI